MYKQLQYNVIKAKCDNKFKRCIITKSNITLGMCQGTLRREVIYDLSWEGQVD